MPLPGLNRQKSQWELGTDDLQEAVKKEALVKKKIGVLDKAKEGGRASLVWWGGAKKGETPKVAYGRAQMDKLVTCLLFKKKTNFEIKGVVWEQAIREPW